MLIETGSIMCLQKLAGGKMCDGLRRYSLGNIALSG
jgi:hypothetical protein